MKIVAIDPKVRIVSGGTWRDFWDMEKAIKYQTEMFLKFGHAAMFKIYTFKRIDDT